MKNVAAQVLATVNAPYGAKVSAHQLAALLADPKSAEDGDVHVFGFLSEVSAPVQKQFIAEMGVNKAKAKKVAAQFAKLSGYKLTLAA